MDEEAASRGTTVYLVDKRIDMLPALLGTNLCSLRPYVERLAFSAIWVRPTTLLHFKMLTDVRRPLILQEMTPDAEIVNVRFFKSVIASKAAFTYAEAQARLDDPCVSLLALSVDEPLANLPFMFLTSSSLNDDITVGIRLLNKLAKKLKAARMKAGALNLASPEVKSERASVFVSPSRPLEQRG